MQYYPNENKEIISRSNNRYEFELSFIKGHNVNTDHKDIIFYNTKNKVVKAITKYLQNGAEIYKGKPKPGLTNDILFTCTDTIEYLYNKYDLIQSISKVKHKKEIVGTFKKRFKNKNYRLE
jgi:hypothetical protein